MVSNLWILTFRNGSYLIDQSINYMIFHLCFLQYKDWLKFFIVIFLGEHVNLIEYCLFAWENKWLRSSAFIIYERNSVYYVIYFLDSSI